jgi:hypothetical protein
MFWREKGTLEFLQSDNNPLYRQTLNGIELVIDNTTYDIDVNGTFSLKKRKVISPSCIKENYKLTISNIFPETTYLGINRATLNGGYFYICPFIRSGGILFNKSQKIYIDKRHNRAEICFDSKGKII